jgi:hypothetical protein
VAHEYAFRWVTKPTKKGRIIEELGQIDRQSSSCLTSGDLSNLSSAGTVVVAFKLALAYFGLTKHPFVHCAHFARLQYIATKVVQYVATRAVEFVLYSTQYASMFFTGVAISGTHVTALELQYVW